MNPVIFEALLSHPPLFQASDRNYIFKQAMTNYQKPMNGD
jgi:hypothetical protein